MKYLVKKTKINGITEKKMVPVGDPPPEQEINPARLKEYRELKAKAEIKSL
jgi:hypothetical protein